MLRRGRVVLGVGFALVALVVGKTMLDAGVFRAVAPLPPGVCTRVEGVRGSEDLVYDADWQQVLISSADFRALEGDPGAFGGLFSWDPSGSAAPQPVRTDFTGRLHPHGLGLWRGADGQRRLFVVNHPSFTESAVEVFSLEADHTLHHLRTVAGPELMNLNDVAPVGPDAFYATRDARTVNGTPARLFETFAQRAWSSLVYFDGQGARPVADGFSYANGVALSADGAVLYLSESTGRGLFAFSRDAATGAVTRLASVQLPGGLDNFSLEADGRLLLAVHPKLFAFLAHAKDPKALSPSKVVRVAFDRGAAAFTVTDVLEDDGATLSGSSVALPLGEGRVLVGSVFAPHFLDCRLR